MNARSSGSAQDQGGGVVLSLYGPAVELRRSEDK
jgi:hypothetical protein